ncbi:MAG: hypothetical protein K0R17_2353 [Rariglobus sp.]|jgi:hypothetical protein|nr:hypothetical protein [Rariglobus sp.]
MKTNLVVLQIDKLLGSAGFIRRKMTWNRSNNSYVDVIDLQLSKAGDAITINAGVMDQWVYKICWDAPPPTFVEEPLCTVRSRIGLLLDGKDVWWREMDEKGMDEVVENIRAHVLPFLDRMHSVETMVKQLADAGVVRQKYPPPIIYFGVLRWKNGDAAGARTLLDDLRKQTVDAWQTRIEKVVEKLSVDKRAQV